MPRNSSGVYQLPAGNPVASGTLIESVWANSTLADVGQALTDSLDRFGRSTMAAPLLLNDGTAVAPGLGFGGESSTGLYRPTSHALGVSVNGAEVARFTTGAITFAQGMTITGALGVADGTAALTRHRLRQRTRQARACIAPARRASFIDFQHASTPASKKCGSTRRAIWVWG